MHKWHLDASTRLGCSGGPAIMPGVNAPRRQAHMASLDLQVPFEASRELLNNTSSFPMKTRNIVQKQGSGIPHEQPYHQVEWRQPMVLAPGQQTGQVCNCLAGPYTWVGKFVTDQTGVARFKGPMGPGQWLLQLDLSPCAGFPICC